MKTLLKITLGLSLTLLLLTNLKSNNGNQLNLSDVKLENLSALSANAEDGHECLYEGACMYVDDPSEKCYGCVTCVPLPNYIMLNVDSFCL